MMSPYPKAENFIELLAEAQEFAFAGTVAQDKEGTARGEERAPAGPSLLGNNTDFAATALPQQLTQLTIAGEPEQLSALTASGWYLRSVGRELLKKHATRVRAAWCGKALQRGEHGVGVIRRPDRAYGRLSGICVCGQTIICPVCGPRVAAFRSNEVAEGFTRAKALGYEPWLHTYTFPHEKAFNLAQEIRDFSNAWRLYTGCRNAKETRTGYLGSNTAREITFNLKNGFHYHHHALRYHLPCKHDTSTFHAGWQAALKSVDRWTEAASKHAFRAEPVTDERGARYTAKISLNVSADARAIGSELASQVTKGRSMMELLFLASKGDELAESFWVQAVATICKGKLSSVRWSPGLRAKLCMSPAKSDEKLAQDEVTRTDECLGYLRPWQWRAVLDGRHEFTLVCAAQEGREATQKFLAGINAGELLTDLPDSANSKH